MMVVFIGLGSGIKGDFNFICKIFIFKNFEIKGVKCNFCEL